MALAWFARLFWLVTITKQSLHSMYGLRIKNRHIITSRINNHASVRRKIVVMSCKQFSENIITGKQDPDEIVGQKNTVK